MKKILLYILILFIGNNCIAQDTKVTITGTGTGGGDAIANFYLKDSALSSDRTLDLNGKDLAFSQGGIALFYIDPNDFQSSLYATSGSGAISGILAINDVIGNNVIVQIAATNGITNPVSILGDAIANTLAYTAGTHTFNGNEADFVLTQQFSSIATNGSNVAGLFSGATVSSWINQISGSDGTTGATIQNSQSGNEINISSAATANAVTVLKIFKDISTVDPPEPGIGGSIDFITKAIAANPSDARQVSNQITSIFTDPDFDGGTLTSEFSITGISNNSANVLLTISGAGIFTLVQSLPSYANNAAAASGGLTAGQLYRISVAGTSTVAIVE